MVYGVESDGDVTVCPIFGGAEESRLGNIKDQSLIEMRRSNAFKAVVIANEKRMAGLQRCKSFAICSGGCPRYSYTENLGIGGVRTECCGYSDLIAHVERRLDIDASHSLLTLQ
jgi:radical SAM protein with 4Fe4S-binding SPASM domain